MNNSRVLISFLRRLTPICFVLLLATGVSLASVDGTFEKTFQVNGPVQLEALTHSGDIMVRSGPAGTVKIVGKIHVGTSWLFSGDKKGKVEEIQKNPPVRQDGNSVRIDYVNMRDVAIDYEITTPAETTLRAHSGSGNHDIDGLKGGVDLESGSGDMQLRALTGNVHTQTGSGNVRGRDINGAIRASAGSGDIEFEETGAGDITIHTGSGNIQLRGINGGLRADAGSGDITAEGTQKNEWEVRTGSGNVHLRLPAEAAFDVDLNTSSGNIDLDHPVITTVQGRVNDSPHHTISGKVHGGGPLLRVHTGSGDISIR
jgi:DUF4097 and DUF4098 domain-containing protein YvlB